MLADFGGAHLGYGLGGGLGNERGGFRHGLDLALLPVFVSKHQSSRIESWKGYAFGASGMVGLGDTPTFLGPDFAYGSSSIGGVSGGGALVYRFKKERCPAGFGISGRATLDFLFIQTGLRLTLLTGGGTTEGIVTLSLGVGRF